MSAQFSLFNRAEPLKVVMPTPKAPPPPPPVVKEQPARERAYALEQHTGCDASALRATWDAPDRYLPADRLSDARVEELLALFERQLGRRP